MTRIGDPPIDDAVLEGLVAAGLAALEAGETVDPQALCADHPECVEVVATTLGLGTKLPALHAASVATDVWLGRVLADRYRLDEPIGRGAAGAVYRAHDLTLRRDVALKLLHAGTLVGPAAEERFLREAEILGQHEHPHVVRVYDRGRTDDGALFLVTELLTGIGLADVLEASRAAMPAGASAAAFAQSAWLSTVLPRATLERSYLRQVVEWIAQLGDGLAAAHRNGVFHRDVKPSNAFIRADGSAVLLDFGLATRSGDPSLTLQTAILGTPWYMPPEQARGRVVPSPVLDVFSLCATLYHLVTLHPPHGDGVDADDVHAVILAARDGETIPAAQRHASLPRDLAAILDHGLEPDPALRYQDVGTLVSDLRAFLDHRPVSVRPIGPLGRVWRRTRRRPARALAFAGGALSIALIAIALPLASKVGADATRAEFAAGLARLAADLCIEGWPDQRAFVPVGERAAAIAELDRLLELDPGDVAVRLMRASERLDAGERDAAAADLRAIASGTDSAYLREVAARYGRADSSLAGIAAVQLGGLPEPVTPAECFVAGFHALRARDAEHAVALLDRAADWLPARDLRLLALLGVRRWDDALAEAHELEGRYGRQTARTRHALAAAALGRREYDKAVAWATDALALRPDRHGPWNNLGYAHLRLGQYPRARECFLRAIAIRPWFDNSRAGLCQVLRSEEDFGSARIEASKLEAPWWRTWELANIDLAEAMAAHRARDVERCRTLALAAAAGYAQVRDDADPDNQKRKSAPASIAFAEAVAGEEITAAFTPFLTTLRADPRNPTQLLNLCDILEGCTLSDDALDALRLWICELGLDLAPNDIRLEQARERVLSSMRKRNR